MPMGKSRSPQRRDVHFGKRRIIAAKKAELATEITENLESRPKKKAKKAKATKKPKNGGLLA